MKSTVETNIPLLNDSRIKRHFAARNRNKSF